LTGNQAAAILGILSRSIDRRWTDMPAGLRYE
jgi:hypothetical protein